MNKVSDTRLFVGRIPYDWTDETIYEAFELYGELKEAVVSVDHTTGQKRGFGFVEYFNTSDASRAVEAMDGMLVNEHPLRVERAAAR